MRNHPIHRRIPRTGVLTFLLLLALGIWSAPIGAEETAVVSDAPSAVPYVYQNSGQGHDMSLRLQYEFGYGSRESRNFAQEGIEQGLRLRFQPWNFVAVEGFGGLVIDSGSGEYESAAASIEIIGRPLRQERHYLNLDLGLGYIYDYRSDHIPRVRLVLGRSFGKFDLSLMGLLEIPVGNAGRDEVDIMTSLAMSYGITPWWRAGLEIAGEDLEGLFESEEAEGGAKILFGPTMNFDLPHNFYLRFNAAAVYAYLSNQKFATGAAKPDEWGFMGRGIIGWSWF